MSRARYGEWSPEQQAAPAEVEALVHEKLRTLAKKLPGDSPDWIRAIQRMREQVETHRIAALHSPDLAAQHVARLLAELREGTEGADVFAGEAVRLVSEDEDEQERLRTVLRREVPKILDAAQVPTFRDAEAEAARVLADPNAIFGADERFAKHLETVDPEEGPKLAHDWLGGSRRRAEEAREPDRQRPLWDGDYLEPKPWKQPDPRPGILWGGWYSRVLDPGPPDRRRPRMPWLWVLARALLPGVRRDLARTRLAAGTTAAAGQLLMSLRATAPRLRVWTEGGREIAELERTNDAPAARLDTARLPVDVAARLVKGNFRDLRAKHALRTLDLVLVALVDEIKREPFDGRRVPKLALPRGRKLAEALGMPSKGDSANRADAALWAWSSVEVSDPDGNLRRFILSPEARKHAPGRPRAWLVVPGELLLPTGVADLLEGARRLGKARKLDKADRGWRRFMPWPDVLAPDDWTTSHRHQGDAAFLALALVLRWTAAAGSAHGVRWLDAPGVRLDDSGWGALLGTAHADPGLAGSRGLALDAWGEADWVAVEGDLVRPGPALPRLARALTEAAELAKRRHRKK